MTHSGVQINAQIKKRSKFSEFFYEIKESIFEIGRAFAYGDWKTRMSFIIMGFGCFSRKQFVKGALYFLLQIAYIFFMIFFGVGYLANFSTLGTTTMKKEWNEARGIFINTPGDNSMLILLFSVITIGISVGFLLIYLSNIKTAYKLQKQVESGKTPATFAQDFKELFDSKFHITLLTLPGLGVLIFTVLPLIFMILMAFTNFDRAHQPPGNLFTWVGLENFKNIFWQNPAQSRTFFGILGWTLTWAVFATFSNYFLGMILAIMINKKGIKLKKLWRGMFVVSIAVPAFVTLLLMSKLLADQGALNVLLKDILHWIDVPIKFLTTTTAARITVIVVNIWVGVPYTMLITSGILMNIPEDLYESARIDGAGPVVQFLKITMPYMLFVTTPYLITQFIGNINNFNVIFFLTGGNPLDLDYFQAGKTDLLVTWLYKQTVNEQNYNLASTIGIMVFIVCSVISLITYNITAGANKEETFS